VYRILTYIFSSYDLFPTPDQAFPIHPCLGKARLSVVKPGSDTRLLPLLTLEELLACTYDLRGRPGGSMSSPWGSLVVVATMFS